MAIRKKKKIQVPRESITKLMTLFNCKKSAVYNALSYSSESEQAQKIRKEAMDNYGGVVTSRIIFND